MVSRWPTAPSMDQERLEKRPLIVSHQSANHDRSPQRAALNQFAILASIGLSTKPSPAAFVLLDEPTKLDTSRIRKSLTARHPGVPVSIPEDRGPVAAIVLKCADSVVAVMDIAAPLPDGWQQVAHRAATHWPEAAATCARHRAHLVVSVMGESEDRVQTARVVTAVVGAIVATHASCSAVLLNWVANSSQTFAELSRSAFAPYPDLPTALWISMHPFRDSASRVGVVTMGLKNFVGREVELEGPASQLKSVLATARGLLAYLLQSGTIVRDGDTIGVSTAERIPVHLLDSERFKGLPVFAASLPVA